MFALKIFFLVSLSFANSMNITPFLTSGNDAQITEFPYLVSIQEVNVQICGGTLLNEKWILSSARCFYLRDINELIIEYGNTVITPGEDGPRKTEIERVIQHEKFALGARLNDISLVESKTPIVTGFHNTFVKLAPSGNKFRSGLVAVHAGWGHTLPGERTNRLQKADLSVLSFEECVEAVDDGIPPTRNNICAIDESVICIGDLGSPLLINGIQVGISSFRSGPVCENVIDKYPNVYTDITHYINWIESHTGIDYQLDVFLHKAA